MVDVRVWLKSEGARLSVCWTRVELACHDGRMKNKTLHVGLVGAGAIVRQRHLPGLAAIEGVQIVAVSNSTYESAERVCRDVLPHATPMKNWADLLMLPDLDIIWIGTTPHMHAPVAISAIEAGRHVFCQARMAMNLQEACDMLEAANRRPDLVTMLCPPPHGMRAGRKVVELLAEGAIGEVRHVRLRSLNGVFINPFAPAHWRQRVELSGLNIMTLGIYVEVLQKWLGAITEVAALSKTFIPARDGYRVEIPDSLEVVCEFECGALGSLSFTSVRPGTATERVEIEGSKGLLMYDFTTESLWLSCDGGEPVEVVLAAGEEGGWTVERDFIESVRNPAAPRPRPNFEDGVAYMRVVQAVADSLVRRCAVRVRA